MTDSNDYLQFRAFCYKSQKLIYGATNSSQSSSWILACYSAMKNKEEWEIQQSTGYRDSNNELIFEGDLIEYSLERTKNRIGVLNDPISLSQEFVFKKNGCLYLGDTFTKLSTIYKVCKKESSTTQKSSFKKIGDISTHFFQWIILRDFNKRF